MKKQDICLSVIVPAFNEGSCLEENILKYYRYLKNRQENFELIIVNDGSSDNTLKIARRLSACFPEIICLNQELNRGKGAAVKAGMLAGSGRYRLFLDADNSTDIGHLEAAWPWLEQGYDLVIGSRNRRDAAESVFISSQAWWKRFLGKSGNLLIQKFIGLDIWDTQCGFKIFSHKAAERIFPRLTLERWLFDIEALLIAQKNNFKTKIIPVSWQNSQDSKVGVRGYLNALRELLIIKKNLQKKLYEINRNDSGAQ